MAAAPPRGRGHLAAKSPNKGPILEGRRKPLEPGEPLEPLEALGSLNLSTPLNLSNATYTVPHRTVVPKQEG